MRFQKHCHKNSFWTLLQLYYIWTRTDGWSLEVQQSARVDKQNSVSTPPVQTVRSTEDGYSTNWIVF